MALRIFNPSQWNPTLLGNLALSIAGDLFEIQNAKDKWSLSSTDDNSIRFELRAGDTFWWDASVGHPNERTEISDKTVLANGVPFDISYKFNLEQGAANTASWLVLGQLHQDSNRDGLPWSPPFEVKLIGEKMAIVVRYNDAKDNPVEQTLFTDVANIQRGHFYDMDVKAVMDPSGNGRLVVTRDGVQIVNYTGPLGYTTQGGVFWKEGIYRAGGAAETLVADYANLSITKGNSVTIPDANSYIAAAVLKVDQVAAETASHTRQAALSGSAKASSTVAVYEGNVLLGRAQTNANGAFSLDVTLGAGNEHLLSTIVTDANGQSGVTSSATSIEIGTAAEIVGRMSGIAAGNVGKIVLTDSTVLQLTSQPQYYQFLKGYANAVGKIQGSYSYLVTTAVTGQSYDKQTYAYTSAGTLTEQIRYAGSKLVFDATYGSNGSQVVKTANALGGFDTTNVASDGFIMAMSRSVIGNIVTLAQSFDRSGAKSTFNYSASTGALTSYTVAAADKSNVTVSVGIVGQSFSTQVFAYDKAGKLIQQDRLTASGTLTFARTNNADGSWALHNYDPATGKETSYIIQNADGSSLQGSFGIVGKPYTAQVLTYNSSGRLSGQTTSNAVGQIGVVPSAIASVLSLAGSNAQTQASPVPSVASTVLQANADGTSSITTFATGSTSIIAHVKTYSSSGAVVGTELYDAAGKRTSADVLTFDGSRLITTYDPTSSVAIASTRTAADGSYKVTTFAVASSTLLASVKSFTAQGTLVETDLYDGSGKLVSTDVFSGGGDVLTSFDPVSGLATSARQTTADGSYKVTAFAAGSSAQIASVKSYTASNILIETDLFDATGKLASTDVFSGGSDLLTLFDANGRALTATLTNADGSRVVTSFQPGSAGLIASVLSYAASGGLVETDLYNSAGKKISARLAMADGSSVLTSFNAATGLPVTSTQTMIDGSTSLTTFQSGAALIASVRMFSPTKVLIESDTFNASGVRTQATIYNADRTRTIVDYGVANLPHAQQSATYAPSGTLVSMTRWYGDAASTVAFTQTVNPDGSSEVHNYDTAGRETVRQILAADGSKDASVMTYADATTPTPSSVVQTHFGPGNQKQWTDTTAADGSHKQVALAANATLTTHANVADTFTSVAAGGDIFVFKPAFGQDIVTNFHAGAGANHDTIDLTALHLQSTPGQSSLAVLGQALQQSGRDAVITITPTDTITLKNTLVANLTREDFRV